jgi:hypothetical protein
MDTDKYGIKIEAKKTYPIEHVISELKRFPETKLGHIIINREHLYEIGIKELEEIEKKVKAKEAKGSNVYVRINDKYQKISDVTILTIKLMPFYTEFVAKIEMEEEGRIKATYLARKYGDFYKNFSKYILENIGHFKDRYIQASMIDIMAEAEKEGVVIENDDFFNGMIPYFKNEGIDVNVDFNSRLVFFKEMRTK